MEPKSRSMTDEALIEVVSKRRDQAAFAALVSRFQAPCIALAFNLCHDSEIADDAVQDAFFSIWVHAGDFESDRGSARSWILRIVATKTITIRAKEGRERRRAKMKQSELATSGAEFETGQVVESDEQMSALRRLIAGLPDLERKIVALYYGADLSQEKIASLLSMPQSTISLRLKRTLEELRTQLAAGGFPALVPMLDGKDLTEAILTGHKVPPRLHERIMHSLIQASRRAAPVPALSFAAKAAWILLPILLIGTAIFLWQSSRTSSPARDELVSSEHESVEMAPSRQAPVAATLFSQSWDFNTPSSAADFEIIEGAWHWVPSQGPDGSGCMVSDKEYFRAKIPIHTKVLPLLLSIRSRPIQIEVEGLPLCSMGIMGDHGIGGYRNRYALFRNVGLPVQINLMKTRWITVRIYLTKGHMDCWTESQRTGISIFELEDNSSFQLLIRGLQFIDELKVEEITFDKVPDVSAYTNALAAIEPAKRVGTVVLPGLQSPIHGKQVTVTFYDRAGKVQE